VINFLIVDWQPKHITLGLFKATNTSEQNLGQKLDRNVGQLCIEEENYVYVKDE
jgi:hypothetical protein